MIEFRAWPKTPRLFRDSVITEKIDGANAAVGILFTSREEEILSSENPGKIVDRGGFEVNGLHNIARVYAQSRNRFITPDRDNYGFASWVWDNADSLISDLGEGLHFGEWWGHGINRGYGMTNRVFSLFNTAKWENAKFETQDLQVVPVLDRCTFNTSYALSALDRLRETGSVAAPGFMRPEGICVYHTASGQVFKALIEHDDRPKGMVT